MNKINYPIHIHTQRIPPELKIVKSAPTQIEDRNEINHSSEIHALDAYLKTFGISTAECSRLCLKIEAHLQSQGIADSRQLPLTRLMQEVHHVISLEKGYLDSVSDNPNWIMDSVDWRLQYWLISDVVESHHAPKSEDKVSEFEKLLIAPPLRRVSMPVASLKCSQWKRVVQVCIEKLAVIGESTAQTFRRLLVNTMNG